MIDCYRLRKTDRRKEADAARTISVQEGKIVFGKVFEKGSSLSSQVIDENKSSSNASVEDDTAYQADFAGWFKGQTQDASNREASWKRMAPSLQCGGDQMKFRAVGPQASGFAVEQGNATSMALSQVPSTCGYSMQRNSLALVMLVPYDGCNMVQESCCRASSHSSCPYQPLLSLPPSFPQSVSPVSSMASANDHHTSEYHHTCEYHQTHY
ncbi:proteoglycan 4-like isoform X2 [Scomber scombrus]